MNNREKKLLIILLFTVVVLSSVYGGKKLLTELNDLEREVQVTDLKAKRYKKSAEVAGLLSEEMNWIELNEPKPIKMAAAMDELQSFVETSLKNQGLAYNSSSVEEIPSEDGFYRRVQTEVKDVRGTAQQMNDWLCELHKPTNYRSVIALKIRPEDKNIQQESDEVEESEQQVIFTLTVEQYLLILKIISILSIRSLFNLW